MLFIIAITIIISFGYLVWLTEKADSLYRYTPIVQRMLTTFNQIMAIPSVVGLVVIGLLVISAGLIANIIIATILNPIRKSVYSEYYYVPIKYHDIPYHNY